MHFFDTDQIDPSQFVYDEQVWVDAETHIFSPMRHADALAKLGLDPSVVVLLEGRFGTGKSGLGRIAAKVAVANGWTPIFCRPGQDNPFECDADRQALPARRGQGWVLGVHGGHRRPLAAEHRSDVHVTAARCLRWLRDQGPTVRVGDDHQPCRRDHSRHDATGPHPRHHLDRGDGPSRRGAVTRTIIGDNLAPDIDFDAVYEATEGYMPAFVREAIERALRYTIARVGDIGLISTEDLVHAASRCEGSSTCTLQPATGRTSCPRWIRCSVRRCSRRSASTPTTCASSSLTWSSQVARCRAS